MSEATQTMAQVGARPPATPPTGPVRLLVLVAAGLGLVLYVIGFFSGLALLNITPVPALLLGGGLLAIATLLPKTGRLLVPAAVAIAVGVLLLVQVVFGLGSLGSSLGSLGRGVSIPALGIVVLILAVLQLAAIVGALLIDVGLLTAPVLGAAGRQGGPSGGPGRHGEYGQPPAGFGQPGYGPPGFGPGGPAGYGSPGPAGYPQQGQQGPQGSSGPPGTYGAPPPPATQGYPSYARAPQPQGGPGYGALFEPPSQPPPASQPLTPPQGGQVSRPLRVEKPWGEVTDPKGVAVQSDEVESAGQPDPPERAAGPPQTLLDVSPVGDDPAAPDQHGRPGRDAAQDHAAHGTGSSGVGAASHHDGQATEIIANPHDAATVERPRPPD